ncbi:MAG TPA: thioredoxin domain-containing protein [Rhizomicrobium sp.]|nr:thioredoxin domain-containing protein [Rhizomicrobium sp.]
MSRKAWIVLGAVVALVIAGAWYFFDSDSDLRPVDQTPASGTVYQPLPTDHTLGDPKAKVTVIEYASPTCPVCAYFMINLYPKLKSDYIDTGKVFYVYRTFLRGPDDGAAEKLARCMPKDKYMSFTDSLFRNQKRWDYEFGIPSPDGVHAALVQLAGEAGMSAADAERCIASTADENAISKVGEDGIARYAVGVTPTFVVNGLSEGGFQNLFARIDAALAGK